MKEKIVLKYCVNDEKGIPFRIFATLKEAENFLQEGWSITPVNVRKYNVFEIFEEAPY